MIGCKVYRISQDSPPDQILYKLRALDMDVILFAKWEGMPPLREFERKGIKTVCWVFDLYWGYSRENRLQDAPYFRAQYVFTTDGGHQALFKDIGINHQCVRQGIYAPDCQLATSVTEPQGVAFVGSDNPANLERATALEYIQGRYKNIFTWVGREDTNEMRGPQLNALYAKTKVLIGDSVFSPSYWSNRVVETLGRGGFLIHQETPGLSTEYPHLITYPRGDLPQLKRLIDYYLEHESERRTIVQRNFDWVRERYTMDRKCAELLSKL